MILTFKNLLDTVSPYIGRAGTCDIKNPANRLAVTTMLQEYLHRAGSLRRWNLTTKSNTFTLPKDLAVILKVKINGVVNQPLSSWYEFFDSTSESDKRCLEDQQWATGVIQEVNNYPTIYDHTGGYVIAELSPKCSGKAATTIIQGLDHNRQSIYTPHKGESIHGEILTLEQGVAKRTTKYFSKITSITKDETDGYVRYLSQTVKGTQPTLLSLLAAKETAAQFRRARIVGSQCQSDSCYSITVLGRVEVQADYHDNDIIPLTELSGIKTLAQASQSLETNDVASAGFKYQLVDRKVEDSNMYNRSNDNMFDVVFELSGGDIDHLS